jgi:DNA-binding GntR family transcriptional regulator
MSVASARAQPLPVARLSRSSLQDHVYRQCCELILNGELVPGQLITIQSLSDAFGVSAMPVREALQRLTAAKALTVISSRSIGIPRLTRERLLDLKRVRLQVEGLAAEWAAPRIARQDIADLKELVGKMATAAVGDRKAYVRYNREFHFVIYRAAGSEALYAIIENLWLQISPYFHFLQESGNYSTSNAQHEFVLNSLRSGDGFAACHGIRNDIEAAGKVLVRLLD